jgi:hypothetical protein
MFTNDYIQKHNLRIKFLLIGNGRLKMNNKQAIIKDIVEIFTNAGFSFETLNIIEDYISNNKNEEKLKEALLKENIDFEFIEKNIPNGFYDLITELNSKDEELLNNLLKILFLIGQEKVFNMWRISLLFDMEIDVVYTEVQKLNVPMYYYILHKAKKLMRNSYSYRDTSCKKYFSQLELLYKGYKEEFIKAFKEAQKEGLAMVLFSKGSGEIKDLQEYINNSLKEYVFGFFNCDYKNTIEISEYLKGNDEFLEAAVEKLKAVTKGIDISSYEYIGKYETLNGLVYYNSQKNEFSKRLLKFLAHYAPYNTVNNIFNLIFPQDDRYIRRNRNLQAEMKKLKSVLKEYNIPDSFYLTWVVQQYFDDYVYDNDRKFLRKIIEFYFNENLECFKEAIELTKGFSKEYLEHYLVKLKSYDDAKEEVRLKYTAAVKEILSNQDFTQNEIDDFVLYMNGEKNVEQVLIPGKFKTVQYLGSYHTRNDLKRIIWLKDTCDLFEKVVRYFIELKNGKLFDYLIDEFIDEGQGSFEEFMEIVDGLEVGIKEMLPIVSAMTLDGHYRNKNYELLQKWIREKPYEVLDNISLCPAEGRRDLIQLIYESDFKTKDNDRFNALIKEFVSDSSKVVKETVMEIAIEALNNEERKEISMSLLKDKKAAVREGAVKLLASVMDEECSEVLKEHLEKDKSSKVKNLIMEYLNIEDEDSQCNQDEMKNINKYCEKNLNKRKKAKIKWLDTDTLPTLILKESGETASESVLDYILIAFADNKEVNINLEIKNMMNYFTEDSLGNLAYEVLVRWYESGAEAKKKWILSLVGMLGDGRTVEFLNKHIKKWPQESRTAIACEALKALAINNSDEAFMIIDSIARKFKFKKVKQAAFEALEFAAKELGIDKEELSDRVVPMLGFDLEGKRTFDYGNRKFIVEVTPELKLSVFKEDGKALKNLPAVGKNDNEEMANKAREEFKILKKQLKTLVEVQSTRLEIALSINRKWTLEKWNKLFVENVIMNRFAIGLIWGIYECDKLKESFRYMEDGTFNTADEDEFEIPEGAEIGLVHPIELSDEEKESWKEQLEDYEIVQPIEQLHRETFVLEDSNVQFIDKFAGIKLNGSSLLGRLTKRGWYTGSVRDAGWYEEFYKEDLKSGLGAELEFSGVGIYDPYEEVTVFMLRFYKAGTVERGSYVYDRITKEKLILPKDIPARFLSEILYDISTATINNSGFDEDWKKEMKNCSNYDDKL